MDGHVEIDSEKVEKLARALIVDIHRERSGRMSEAIRLAMDHPRRQSFFQWLFRCEYKYRNRTEADSYLWSKHSLYCTTWYDSKGDEISDYYRCVEEDMEKLIKSIPNKGSTKYLLPIKTMILLVEGLPKHG